MAVSELMAQLKRIAYHEAGHALVMVIVGHHFRGIELYETPDEQGALGRVLAAKWPDHCVAGGLLARKKVRHYDV